MRQWGQNSLCCKKKVITQRPRHFTRRRAHHSKALVKAHLLRQVPRPEMHQKEYDLGFAAYAFAVRSQQFGCNA